MSYAHAHEGTVAIFQFFCIFIQDMANFKREYNKWSSFKGRLTIGLQGAFDRDQCLRKSMGVYENGLFKLYGWYKTEGDNWRDWEQTGQIQRKINRSLRGLVGADREHSLCVAENGTLRGGRGTFINVEYYAKCNIPTPDTVQECSREIINAIQG